MGMAEWALDVGGEGWESALEMLDEGFMSQK